MKVIFYEITRNASAIVVLAMEEEEVFYTENIIPEGVDGLVKQETTGNGSTRITATENLILVAEKFHRSGQGAKHIRYIRPDRQTEGLHFAEFKPFPRARSALKKANRPRVHVPGGLHNLVIYRDEIAVPDFAVKGSHGWIVLRTDIDRYLSLLPCFHDNGKIIRFWIDHVGWIDTPDKCSIKISDHDPRDDRPPFYYDKKNGCQATSNRHIFLVEIDQGSGKVQRIIDTVSGREFEAVVCKINPRPCFIKKGRKIPAGCFQN